MRLGAIVISVGNRVKVALIKQLPLANVGSILDIWRTSNWILNIWRTSSWVLQYIIKQVFFFIIEVALIKQLPQTNVGYGILNIWRTSNWILKESL